MSIKKYLKEEFNLYRAEQIMQHQWTQTLIEEILSEWSTLSQMIGDTPGGQQLVRFMHKNHLLGSAVEWQEHPFGERVFWKQFKNHPDNFIIITGSVGVAAVKPFADDFERGRQRKGAAYNPSTDPSMRYQIIAYRKEGQVNPALFRATNDDAAERDPDPTVYKARGGRPSKKDTRNPENIFDRIGEQIGRLQGVYFGYRGVEREKMAQRRPEKVPANFSQELDTVLARLEPVFKKLLNRITAEQLSIITNRMRRAIDNDNYDVISDLKPRAERIKELRRAIDVSGNVEVRGPVRDLVMNSIAMASGTRNPQEQAEWLKDLSSQSSAKLAPMIDAMRQNLIRA